VIKLVLDTFCEVYDLLKHKADAEFWNLQEHVDQGKLVPGAIYLVGRRQMQVNADLVRQLVESKIVQVIFSNPAEGSETIKTHVAQYGIQDLLLTKQMLLIGGGDMESSYPCLQYDSFLPKLLDYTENCQAIENYKNKSTTDRPYKFLFLNGRYRTHRTYLLNKLQPLLSQAIWTNLDSTAGPIKTLESKYELPRYQQNISITDAGFVKNQLFNNEWGEIYLAEQPYLDTYFSVVTETVFNYPYSFRTEKIWKPIAIGHPFIAVANRGYYKDLHDLGFQTFGHVIDESFDQIDNNYDRLNKISTVVKDLCQQDLASFLKECYNVCKYNQQHLADIRLRVRAEFPQRFEQFIQKNFKI
jgi:hypothetical protein